VADPRADSRTLAAGAILLQTMGAEVCRETWMTAPPGEGRGGRLRGVQRAELVDRGHRREVSQGKALVDVAEGAGVKHFVYTSVGGADDRPGATLREQVAHRGAGAAAGMRGRS